MHLKYITQKTRRIYEGCLLPEHTPSLLNIQLFKTIGAYPDYWFFHIPSIETTTSLQTIPQSRQGGKGDRGDRGDRKGGGQPVSVGGELQPRQPPEV